MTAHFAPPDDLPHSIEAEKQVLGCILVNNAAFGRVQAFLRPEHFFFDVHRRIYAAASAMIDKGELADPLTMKPYFERDTGLADVGGYGYIVGLFAQAASVIDTEHYGRTVRDLAMRRELVTTAQVLMREATAANVERPALAIAEAAEARLLALHDDGAEGARAEQLGAALQKSLDHMVAVAEGKRYGLASGIPELDARFSGLTPGRLTIAAGRPGMGKSALGLQIALNVARAGHGVAVFSLEMGDAETGDRILSEASQIPFFTMGRAGGVSPEAFARLQRTAAGMADLPFWLLTRSDLTVGAIRAELARLRRRHTVDLVVIDYLQLITPESTYRGQKVNEVSEISAGLKRLAKATGAAVLALSQLSRDVEKRADSKRPVISDLRDSGSLEQDADNVLLLYREEYYLQQRQPDESDPAARAAWERDMDPHRNVCEVIIAKQRHGPKGTARCWFDPATNRFGRREIGPPGGDPWEGFEGLEGR